MHASNCDSSYLRQKAGVARHSRCLSMTKKNEPLLAPGLTGPANVLDGSTLEVSADRVKSKFIYKDSNNSRPQWLCFTHDGCAYDVCSKHEEPGCEELRPRGMLPSRGFL